MNKFFGASKWITGVLILSMPIALIYFLGSQMAYGQVQSRFEAYNAIPEYTRLDQLTSLEPEAPVMLRGIVLPAQHGDAISNSNAPLLVYQERPLDGRAVRFQETFPLMLPAFMIQLEDGSVQAISNPDDERIISHELHRVVHGDREFTGFQVGDMVTLTGKWQPAKEINEQPALAAVTGISSVSKAALLAEVGDALVQVKRTRNWLGMVTLIGILLLCLQLYFHRKARPSDSGSNASIFDSEGLSSGLRVEQNTTVAGD